MPMESLLTNLPGNFRDRLHVRASGRMAEGAVNQMIQDARASMSHSLKKDLYFLNYVWGGMHLYMSAVP